MLITSWRAPEFDTLESQCYRSNLFACLSKNFGTEPKEIKNYLYGHGFVYSEYLKKCYNDYGEF